MSNSINIDNTPMAIVVAIIFCHGDPDLLDMVIKLICALAQYFSYLAL
jgi:hypothetical protein